MKHILSIFLLMFCGTLLAETSEPSLPQLRLTLPAECITGGLSVNGTVLQEYQVGTMVLTDTEGEVVSLPMKCKIHGATAAHYTMKPSLAMKLSDASGEIDTCLLGLRECSSYILDAMAIDRINMRNRVAFDIWNAMSRLPYETQFDGRNGTEGRFVELYINDNSYGIYCLSDKINRKLLGLKKPKTNTDGTLKTLRGALYKSGTTDIADQNTPGFFLDYTVCVAEYHNAWELKEPEDFACEEAWAPLLEFYSGSNHNYAYVKQRYYLDNLADNQLLVMALAIQDNWGNKNKYVSVVDMSAADDAARLVYTPWDLDTSLGGAYDGRYYDGNYSDWKPADIAKSATQVFSVCQGQSEYKDLLRNRWVELRETELSVESVAQRLRDYTALLEQSGAWQRQWSTFQARSSRPMLVENLSSEVELIIVWYADRFAQLDEYFGVETDVKPVVAPSQPRKFIDNGSLLIERQGRCYDVQGRLVLDPIGDASRGEVAQR